MDNDTGGNKQPRWWLWLGGIVGVVTIFGTLIGVLVTLKVITPPVQPTPAPKFVTYNDPHVGCNGKDTGFAANDPWLAQNGSNQNDTFACSPAGLTITQPADPKYLSATLLKLPPPHDSPTHDYSVSVTASNFSNARVCAGIEFRIDQNSAGAYILEVCETGVWSFAKTIASNGFTNVLNHGTVQTASSYMISLEITNNALTILMGTVTLPSITLDSSYVTDDYIGLTVDTGDPLAPDLSGTAPGGSATFSQFVFQPLP